MTGSRVRSQNVISEISLAKIYIGRLQFVPRSESTDGASEAALEWTFGKS